MKLLTGLFILPLSLTAFAQTQDESRIVSNLMGEAKELLRESYHVVSKVASLSNCDDNSLKSIIPYSQILTKISAEEKDVYIELIKIESYDLDKEMIQEALYHDINHVENSIEKLDALRIECLQQEKQSGKPSTVVYGIAN